MPLPKPSTGESRNDFVSRCVSFVKGEDPNTPNDQAVAMCMTQWRNKQMGINSIQLKWNEKIAEIASKEDVFKIKGIAITSTTTSNGHTFVPEELEKAALGLKGVPLLKDHENTVDSIVGKVTESRFDATTGSISFEALVIDKDMQTKIRLGLLDSVSIGAQVQELEETEGEIIPRGLEFKELSLVAIPADTNATFTVALKQAWKSNIHKFSDSSATPDESSQSSINGEQEVKGGDKEMAEEEQEAKEEEASEEPAEEAPAEAEAPAEEPKEEPQEAVTEEKVKKMIKAALLREADEDEVKPEEPKEKPKEEPKEEPAEAPAEAEPEAEEEEAGEDKLEEVYESRGRAITLVRSKY